MWAGSSQLKNGYPKGSGADEASRLQQLLDVTTQTNASFSSCQETYQAQQQRIESLLKANNINYSLPLILCEKSKENWLGDSMANLSIYEVARFYLHFLIASLSGKWKPKLAALLVGTLTWRDPEVMVPSLPVESHVVMLATSSSTNSLKVLNG